jgi:two-component system response regulator DctR
LASISKAKPKTPRKASGSSENSSLKLVSLDVMMPERDGIDSVAAFRTMRKESPETAIVVVSAVPFEKTRDTFLNEGAIAYVIKPFGQFSFEPVRQKLQRAFPAWTA